MLTLDCVSKSYASGQGHQQVLDRVSLDLEPGRFTALVGPSGCGKSTLLNLCGLIDRPDEGRVVWRDEELSHASAARLTDIRRQHIGFVFQTFNLIPVMSVWDNIAYPLLLTQTTKAEQKRRVGDVIDAVGLGGFSRKRPDELSGGQRQRVAIARALVKQPELVIADEPTASLDEDTALTVIRLMKNLSHHYRTTVVVATHDARLTPFCERVYRLSHGSLVPDAQPAAEEVLP